MRTVTSDVQFPVASNPDVLLVPVVDADGGGNGNNGNGELEDALNKVRKHAEPPSSQKRRELEELQAHLGRSPPPPLSRDSTAANTTAISTGDEQQQQQEGGGKEGELAAAPAAAAPVAGPASVEWTAQCVAR